MYDGRTQMQCARSTQIRVHRVERKMFRSLRCILLVTKVKGTIGRSRIVLLENGRKVS